MLKRSGGVALQARLAAAAPTQQQGSRSSVQPYSPGWLQQQQLLHSGASGAARLLA